MSLNSVLTTAKSSNGASENYTALDQVCDFAYGQVCRHEQILSYFGEDFDTAKCPGCDRCHPTAQDEVVPLDNDQLVIVRKALAGVARAQGRFGLKKVAGMLAGSKARAVLDSGLSALSIRRSAQGIGDQWLL